jgi:hypothetical protein
MALPQHWFRDGRALGALWAAIALANGCYDLREDELQCEEAVAHLMECCDDFNASEVRCIYERGDCGSETVHPDLSVEQSRTIRRLSCAEVRARGLCDHTAFGKSPRSSS